MTFHVVNSLTANVLHKVMRWWLLAVAVAPHTGKIISMFLKEEKISYKKAY